MINKIGRHLIEADDRVFLGFSALLFVASAMVTIVWCTSMSSMSGMQMPGNWTMSMTWMRMPGQTWLNAMASFLAMWVVMMVAMMLPSLTPMLQRYRQHIKKMGTTQINGLTLLAGTGYFFVWTVFGAIVFLLGAALAAVVMQYSALARIAPIVFGVLILLAGIFQFTSWKEHYLGCCRKASSRGIQKISLRKAFQHGLQIGLDCVYCCANLIAILLVIGVMDLRTMAIITAAITIERLVPAGERMAQLMGALIMIAGVFLITQTILF